MGLTCTDIPASVWCNGNLHYYEADINNAESKPWAVHCPNSNSPKASAWNRPKVSTDDAKWWANSRAVLRTFAKSGNQFTADDITNATGWPTEDNNVGALFREAKQQNIIREIGTTQSTRPEAHGRTIKVWQGWPDRSRQAQIDDD